MRLLGPGGSVLVLEDAELLELDPDTAEEDGDEVTVLEDEDEVWLEDEKVVALEADGWFEEELEAPADEDWLEDEDGLDDEELPWLENGEVVALEDDDVLGGTLAIMT